MTREGDYRPHTTVGIIAARTLTCVGIIAVRTLYCELLDDRSMSPTVSLQYKSTATNA
jgi:hypothetical protein